MKLLIFFFLVMPGLVIAYALILRPILSRIPAFHDFYTEANGFWATVWAWCGNSITIAWAKIVGGVGAAFELVDPISTMLGDPDLKNQVTDLLKTNPKVLGYFLMAVSFITIFARIRSIGKA